MGGISLGGILVIVGIILAIVWNLWIGLIIALIGLLAFGGFASGREGRLGGERFATAREAPDRGEPPVVLAPDVGVHRKRRRLALVDE
jgi:hypothetical protein